MGELVKTNSRELLGCYISGVSMETVLSILLLDCFLSRPSDWFSYSYDLM